MRFSLLLFTCLIFALTPVAADDIKISIVDERQPIPDIATRNAKRAEIESIFEVASVDRRDEKRKLAARLLQTAKGTTKDPAGKFVLMNLARESSEESGDIDGAMTAIDRIVDEYQADDFVLRLTALRNLSNSAGLLSNEKAGIQQAGLKLLAEYEAADEYAKAVDTAKMMIVVGKQLRDLPMATRMQSQVTRLETIVAEYKTYLSAVTELRFDPDKGAPNDTVGRFLAFRKGQWKDALPHLSKSNREGLAQVAQLETAAEDPAQFSKVASLWSTLADGWDDPAVQKLMRSRSAAFYQQALSQLTGLSKVAAQRELDGLLAKGVKPMNLTGEKSGANNIAVSSVAVSTSNFPLLDNFIRDLRWAKDGEVVDLVPWVRFPEDVIDGSWEKSSEGHLVSPKTDISRIRLPAILPAEYDVDFEVVPENPDFAILLSSPIGTHFWALVEGFGDKLISGLNNVDGKNIETNQTRHLGRVLNYGKSNRIEVSVRRTGILFKVNGKQICHYRDNFARLGFSRLSDQNDFPSIQFSSHKSVLKIRSAKVTVHRDSRTPFPRYPSPAKGRSFWYAKNLTELPARYSQASQVYLDDMPEISFHSGDGVIGKRGYTGRGEAFVFNKQRYAHALWMHPSTRGGTSRIVYNLDGNFKKFSAEVGLCEPHPTRIGKSMDGRLTFQVYGDGKLIAELRDQKVRSSKIPITADVSGVKTLTLLAIVHWKQTRAYAAWLNPMVTR